MTLTRRAFTSSLLGLIPAGLIPAGLVAKWGWRPEPGNLILFPSKEDALSFSQSRVEPHIAGFVRDNPRVGDGLGGYEEARTFFESREDAELYLQANPGSVWVSV